METNQAPYTKFYISRSRQMNTVEFEVQEQGSEKEFARGVEILNSFLRTVLT